MSAQCADNTGMSADSQLDKLKFDANGLVPVIVQDHANGEVLMMAYMNRDAIEQTIATGKVHTYSRSRGRLALKGETSGHFQLVKEIRTDCDRDVVLLKVEQIVAACHEGYRSCFFRQYDAGAGDWRIVAAKAFDPDAVYQQQKK
jgi:phosphoribosyl-AMP cyclohydrolase